MPASDLPSNIPKRKPRTTRTSGKALSIALSGREAPYPAYRFSGRQFVEKPTNNPFDGL